MDEDDLTEFDDAEEIYNDMIFDALKTRETFGFVDRG